MDYSYIDKNVADVRARMARAASEAGRAGEDITLLAAVKYVDTDAVNYIHTRCGINDIGENRVQQLLERWDKLEHDGLRVHFIGSLQTNKVKYIVDKVCMIHSVDSERLAAEIERQCAKIGRVMDVLVEINCGREENKTGVLPEQAEALCQKISEMPHLRLRGFMTMAPKCEYVAEYEKYFTETYNLIIDIWEKKLYNIERPIISMGMSGSFEAAVRCGSTCVRVGNILFAE
ncbi:MAG: YggS family pyridoxal phosphate-dependent enzyme [Clostridia bacterium]|nr:YggS family pyridoxal phosphate-dependent enzyme [Clostridia bacterium]